MRSTATAVLAAFGSLAAAAPAPAPFQLPPYAAVSNYCEFNTYLWYVGGDVSRQFTNPAHAGYQAEAITADPVSGGRALKITTEENGLSSGAAHLVLAYNFDEPEVWYEMSEVFGSPFEGHKLKVQALDDGCEDFAWEDGVQPAGSNLQKCEAKRGFHLVLCAGSKWDPETK